MDQGNRADFVEILNPQRQDATPISTFVEALAVSVEPRACSTLIKRLSTELPLTPIGAGVDLSHLKRVKRVVAIDKAQQSDESQIDSYQNADSSERQPTETRKRKHVSRDVAVLKVLLGATTVLEARFGRLSSDETTIDLSHLVDLFPIDAVHTVQVPSRRAESEAEWNELNAAWPMVYLPNKTKEFLEAEMQLGVDELLMMRNGMDAAIDDAQQFRDQYQASRLDVCGTFYGVVIVCPQSGNVVATANGERQLQTPRSLQRAPVNPLSTPYLLAIQAVSRIERQAITTSVGGTQSECFQNGQYLCTGYDVYGTLEPTVYEAMALVHSRIRRLVFGCTRHDTGLLNGGIADAFVHALPGTNHHYRSFQCTKSSEVWKQCCHQNNAWSETD